MDAIEKAKVFISKEDFLEVKYENLCLSPSKVFEEIMDFIGIQ